MSKASTQPAVRPCQVMANSRSKRPYPEGERVQMTPAWKALVVAELGKRGWSRSRLALELGVERSLVYRLFPTAPRSDEVMGSAVVPLVCEILGLHAPMVPSEIARDVHDQRILELARALPVESKISLIRFIEGLLSKPPG